MKYRPSPAAKMSVEPKSLFADEVGGEAGVVVGIGLAVRHVGRVERKDFQTGLEVAEEEFVITRVVAGGLGERAACVDGQTVGEFGTGGRVAHGGSICSAREELVLSANS